MRHIHTPGIDRNSFNDLNSSNNNVNSNWKIYQTTKLYEMLSHSLPPLSLSLFGTRKLANFVPLLFEWNAHHRFLQFVSVDFIFHFLSSPNRTFFVVVLLLLRLLIRILALMRFGGKKFVDAQWSSSSLSTFSLMSKCFLYDSNSSGNSHKSSATATATICTFVRARERERKG